MIRPYDIWYNQTSADFLKATRPLVAPQTNNDRAIQKVVFQKIAILGRFGATTLAILAIAQALFNPARLALVPFYYLVFEGSNILSNYADTLPGENNGWRNWFWNLFRQRSYKIFSNTDPLFKGAPVIEYVYKTFILKSINTILITKKNFWEK